MDHYKSPSKTSQKTWNKKKSEDGNKPPSRGSQTKLNSQSTSNTSKVFSTLPVTDWLPLNKEEADLRGWHELDVILVSGDAYVDHPSFGTAVIGRIIEAEGFKVGIISQPDWKGNLEDFKKFGKPKYFFGVTSGCMDSMVNHYTANRRLRSSDAYTSGGLAGRRPDYASTVYTRALKRAYPDVPVVIGGIEASLRRVTHYDYWSDQLLPSVLVDSGADLLLYGMGEQALLEMLRLVKKGVPLTSLNNIAQTAFLQPKSSDLPNSKKWENRELNSHADCLKDKLAYARNFKYVEIESNKQYAKQLHQVVGKRRLVINPPFQTMSEKEIDRSFDLPYTRLPHPSHQAEGTIPAYEMIRHSINMHRGCFGGCSFCTISAHQGKMIASRSQESILKEVDKVTKMPDFKGYISDLGGPSANMYGMKGIDQSICDKCIAPSCIHPGVCSNLDVSHGKLLDVYKKSAAHPEVKKAFVSSGVRYDLLVGKNEEDRKANKMDEYTEQLISNHVSGRLKVAPEHTSDKVLKLMRKPSFDLFYDFKKHFDRICEKAGLKQQLIPYFISSHPGSDEEAMANLAVQTKDLGFQLEQVQGFTPTPMTVATVIYYAGVHPYTLKPVYTAKSEEERKTQSNFFFWYKKDKQGWIRKSLQKMGRKDYEQKLLGKPGSEASYNKNESDPDSRTHPDLYNKASSSFTKSHENRSSSNKNKNSSGAKLKNKAEKTSKSPWNKK